MALAEVSCFRQCQKVSCSSETQRSAGQIWIAGTPHQVLHIATKIGSFASAVLVYEWPMFHGGRTSVAYSTKVLILLQ